MDLLYIRGAGSLMGSGQSLIWASVGLLSSTRESLCNAGGFLEFTAVTFGVVYRLMKI